MQIFKDGQVAHYKTIFSNVSFPASGPSDAFLAERGAYKVSLFRDHDRATQKLVPCEPVIENGFAYVVAVENKTAEEIAADVASKSAQMRANRDRALEASDWRVIRAAETGVAMEADWATYRQALRDLPNAEGWPDVTLPHDPDYVELEIQGA
jgi:hypothetical protein